MKAPTRFKRAHSSGIAGDLMVAGGTEAPSEGALERAAHRLGLPAGLLATLAVTATTTSATATTSAAIGGASTSTSGAIALITAAKAAALGIGLGATLAVGAHWVRSSSSGDTPAPRTAVTAPSRETPRSVQLAPTGDVPSANVPVAALSAEPQLAVSSNRSAPISTSAPHSAAPTFENPGVPSTANDAEPREPAGAGITPPPPIRRAENASQGPMAAAAVATTAPQPFSDPRLAREVTSLDRARTFENHGAPAAALRELDDFNRTYGYAAMQREALLVRLDVLLALGQRGAAAQIARELLALGVPAAQQSRLRELVGQSTSNSTRH